MTLYTIALSFIYVDTKEWVLRKLDVPSTEELKNAWSEWEVRCLVVFSLALQILLMISAYVRKMYQGRFEPVVAAIVWSIYMLADWVATVAMTTILRGTFEKESALVVLWTPFLLWHLGNPANITAYSLDDNELWLRHFLGLLANGVEAVYIYLRFRIAGAPNFVGITKNMYYLDFMVVPILIGGILKYGERIVALRCASDEQLRIALFSEARSKFSRGKKMIRIGLYESAETDRDVEEANGMAPEVKFLQEAHASFEIFRPLFLGLPFNISKKYYDNRVFMGSKSAKEAFQLVKIELQFLYDTFFTKNPIQQRFHKLDIVLRGFYFLSALFVLAVFSLTMKNIGHIHIARADIVVTYLLLAGAIFLDVYASVLHLVSIWNLVFGINVGSKLHKMYNWLVGFRFRSIKSQGIIVKIAQYDLLKDYRLTSEDSIFTPVINLIDPNELRNKYDLLSWVEMDDDLKEFIYANLKEECRNFVNKDPTSTFLSDEKSIHSALDHYLTKNIVKLDIPKFDFTRDVLIWHIATKLVYYNNLDKSSRALSSSCRRSNALSDYMLYLELVHPSMMPKEFGEIMAKEDFLPAKKRIGEIKKNIYQTIFFGDSQQQINKDLSTALKQVATNMLNDSVNFMFQMDLPQSSTLLEGRALAKGLLGSINRSGKICDEDEMWKMLSGVWMKLLIHVANHCSWKEHTLRLRHGGEMITYVSLLMAHLGLSKDIHPKAEGSHNEANV